MRNTEKNKIGVAHDDDRANSIRDLVFPDVRPFRWERQGQAKAAGDRQELMNDATPEGELVNLNDNS